MELEKSLHDRISVAHEKIYDLLYDDNGARDKTGLPEGVEGKLWDFIEGIGSYLDRIFSGRMSLAEMCKDHMQIVEDWVMDIENTLTPLSSCRMCGQGQG